MKIKVLLISSFFLFVLFPLYSSASVVYEQSGSIWTHGEPEYDPIRNKYWLRFDPFEVDSIYLASYGDDSTYTNVVTDKTFVDTYYNRFIGLSDFTCNVYYLSKYYDGSGNLLGTLKFYANEITGGACDSTSGLVEEDLPFDDSPYEITNPYPDSGDDGSGDDGSGDDGSGDDGSGDDGSGDDGSGDVPTPQEVCATIVCECIESLKQVNNSIRDVLSNNGVKLDNINSNLSNVNSKLNDVNSNLISVGFKLDELNTTADLILGEMKTDDVVTDGNMPSVPIIDSSGLIEKNKPDEPPVFKDDTIYFEDQGDAVIPSALPQVPDPAECWDAVGTQCKEPDGTPEKELSKEDEQNLDVEFNIDDELEKEDFSLEDELQKDNFSKENELEKDSFNQTENYNQTNNNFSKTHEYEQTDFYD